MARRDARRKTLRHMRRSTEALSEMLAHTVARARALQKQQEALLGPAASQEELAAQCDTKTMKELTAILKDIAAVAHSLEEGENPAGGPAGVVLLPPVTLADAAGDVPESSVIPMILAEAAPPAAEGPAGPPGIPDIPAASRPAQEIAGDTPPEYPAPVGEDSDRAAAGEADA